MMHDIDGRESWDAIGARERYLKPCLRPGFTLEDLGAKPGDGNVIRAQTWPIWLG